MKSNRMFYIIWLFIGCGHSMPNASPAEIDPTSATQVVIDPPPPSNASGTLHLFYPNTDFMLTFDREVVAVIVNDTPAQGSGFHWKWSTEPNLVEEKGPITLHIMWTNRNGSKAFAKVGPYHFGWGNEAPPEIHTGSVQDGATDVDPAPINISGFQFDFNEPVEGTIKLTDEAGTNLHWIGHVEGQTATLKPNERQKLLNATTYKIEIDVRDRGNWRTQATLSFFTKIK